MRKAARNYGRVWKSNITTIKEERTSFEALINRLNPNSEMDYEAVDLLNGLLELISDNRLTADQALKHKFFSSLNHH